VDADCRVRGMRNLFHFSTAVFPSAKSINPTGAGFCLVEAHLADFEKITEGVLHRTNKKVYTLDEMKDKYIGAIGTAKREAYENELHAELNKEA
jgi:hypothetical protein